MVEGKRDFCDVSIAILAMKGVGIGCKVNTAVRKQKPLKSVKIGNYI